jgi:hypothetical protein
VYEASVRDKSTKVGKAVPLDEPGGLGRSVDVKAGSLKLFYTW